MKNIQLLLVLFISSILFAQQNKKPNVLFIIADDLTATAVSSYENKVSKTPNIDKLAAKRELDIPKPIVNIRFVVLHEHPLCRVIIQMPPLLLAILVEERILVQTDKHGHNYLKTMVINTARVSKIFHMGVPIDIETGSNGQDDEASWTERFNSQGPEWKAIGQAELVQGNPDGKIERKGGNVMTIVKAEGDDLVHSDGKTAQKAIELIKKHKNEPFFLASWIC